MYIADNFNTFDKYETEQKRQERLRKKHAREWREKEYNNKGGNEE